MCQSSYFGYKFSRYLKVFIIKNNIEIDRRVHTIILLCNICRLILFQPLISRQIRTMYDTETEIYSQYSVGFTKWYQKPLYKKYLVGYCQITNYLYM